MSRIEIFDGFGRVHLMVAVGFVAATLGFLYLAVKVVRNAWK